ncbi:MAG: hypothetical protein H7288_13365 [Kineosporiaceae bacterium]|nr:hypothetical protein [Aeromicrobium sp.]
MMPAWVYIATAIWVILEALASIWLVGRARTVRTPIDAVISTVMLGWVAFLLIAAVSR